VFSAQHTPDSNVTGMTLRQTGWHVTAATLAFDYERLAGWQQEGHARTIDQKANEWRVDFGKNFLLFFLGADTRYDSDTLHSYGLPSQSNSLDSVV
jgi:hypothetical protein